MMDRGLVEGGVESRRRFVTRGGEGERGRESDLVHSGHQLGHQLVDTSWDAVDTRCLAGQVNYTIDLQL